MRNGKITRRVWCPRTTEESVFKKKAKRSTAIEMFIKMKAYMSPLGLATWVWW